MVFEVLEGDKPLPFHGAADAPLVSFHALGPVVSPMADRYVYLSELKRDEALYPDKTIEVAFVLTDVDTALEDIKLTGSSSRVDLLPAEKITFKGNSALEQ
jgi:hypothetical protein